jgi:predicted RND superfamily exporter protein
VYQLDFNSYLEERFPEDDPSGFMVELVSTIIRQQAFSDTVSEDTSYAIFSVMFVFLYFIIHLRSLFLAFIGISLILFSFPVTVCITEGIFRVSYFSNLHSLAVFIVLGIAADDIFVFIDAWRQSEKIAPRFFRDDKKLRMAYAWKRSVKAIFVTSSTTSVAFFANAFSPIMPIKAFGIFAGVIIPINYILVVLFLPPATIFFEQHIEGRFCKFIGSFRQTTSERVMTMARTNSQLYGDQSVKDDENASNYSQIERFFNQ